MSGLECTIGSSRFKLNILFYTFMPVFLAFKTFNYYINIKLLAQYSTLNSYINIPIYLT